MIFIGADHAGFHLKEILKKYFDSKGIAFHDCGAFQYEKDDDYPKFAGCVAKEVAQSVHNQGILICGNGQGMCIAANKIRGIRAVTGFSLYAAKTSKTDDHANILCLAARVLSEKKAVKIVEVWLQTPFSELERHRRRIKELESSEV